MAVPNRVSTTYAGEGGASRSPSASKGNYTYNPKTGTWVPTAPTAGQAPSATTDEMEKVPPEVSGDDSSQVDNKTEADREYIEIELKTLVGDLTVVPSQKNIRIQVNKTVEVEGVGKYLSGKYFVSAIKRTISKDGGYSQTLSVLKNGFGDSLKKASGSSSSPSYSYSPSSTPSAVESTPPSAGSVDRNDTVEKSATPVKTGDTIKIVGDAVYSNASSGVKVPEWVKEKTLTVQQVSEDGTRVLLMPINSWVYTRYIQKA